MLFEPWDAADVFFEGSVHAALNRTIT